MLELNDSDHIPQAKSFKVREVYYEGERWSQWPRGLKVWSRSQCVFYDRLITGNCSKKHPKYEALVKYLTRHLITSPNQPLIFTNCKLRSVSTSYFEKFHWSLLRDIYKNMGK